MTSDTKSAYQPLRCRNCGSEIVGDDAGGWLHEWTMSRYCPQRLAEPDPSRETAEVFGLR